MEILNTMAEIALDHAALLDDIRACDPGPNRAAFWWLGQHSFIVKAGDRVIYIDPFFAPWESRQTPPLLSFDEPNNADLVLVTHDHGDHLCPETLSHMARQNPNALFISPRTATRRMLEDAQIPSDRYRPLNAGESLDSQGIKVTAIKSKHESFDEDPVLGFPFLGYVVEANGATFYHSGDCILYEGLLTTLRQWPRFDVLMLPINGRDAERFLRNCIGNFTYQEVVEIAGELRPGLVVPSHYDMFVGNQEDPDKFVRFLNAKFPELASWVGPAGTRVLFPEPTE